jgi:hypothetical protein
MTPFMIASEMSGNSADEALDTIRFHNRQAKKDIKKNNKKWNRMLRDTMRQVTSVSCGQLESKRISRPITSTETQGAIVDLTSVASRMEDLRKTANMLDLERRERWAMEKALRGVTEDPNTVGTEEINTLRTEFDQAKSNIENCLADPYAVQSWQGAKEETLERLRTAKEELRLATASGRRRITRQSNANIWHATRSGAGGTRATRRRGRRARRRAITQGSTRASQRFAAIPSTESGFNATSAPYSATAPPPFGMACSLPSGINISNLSSQALSAELQRRQSRETLLSELRSVLNRWTTDASRAGVSPSSRDQLDSLWTQIQSSVNSV